jgi:hypothetical protein
MPNDPQYIDPNPGVSRSLVLNTTLNDAASRNGINQLRGLDSKGSLGSGIPKHVTNVGASVAQASTGSTSTVRVTFHRDPSDKNYSAAGVWVKGYQGNNNPVQVAQSYESPATFVLNNTGEPVSILVQSVGNGGQAPLSSAPTTGITLPKSSVSGYGTGTTVSYTPKFPPPSGGLIVSGTPRTGDILRYNMYGDSSWDSTSSIIRQVYFACDDAQNGGGSANNLVGRGNFAGATSAGTTTQINATATEGAAIKFLSAATASSGTGYYYSQTGAGNGRFVLGTIRRFASRSMLMQTANTRFFTGMADNANNYNPSAADAPNNNFIGFRYSVTTDASIMAVCQTSNVAITTSATGVSPSTSVSQLLEWFYDGSTVYFYVDGALKTSISTNVPANTTALNLIVAADNKGTANAIAFQLQLVGVTQR